MAADGSPEAELADKEVEAAEARLEVALASALVGHDEEDGLSGDESDDAPSGSAIEEEGVECALWPDLYHSTAMCETHARLTDARRLRHVEEDPFAHDWAEEEPPPVNVYAYKAAWRLE